MRVPPVALGRAVAEATALTLARAVHEPRLVGEPWEVGVAVPVPPEAERAPESDGKPVAVAVDVRLPAADPDWVAVAEPLGLAVA